MKSELSTVGKREVVTSFTVKHVCALLWQLTCHNVSNTSSNLPWLCPSCLCCSMKSVFQIMSHFEHLQASVYIKRCAGYGIHFSQKTLWETGQEILQIHILGKLKQSINTDHCQDIDLVLLCSAYSLIWPWLARNALGVPSLYLNWSLFASFQFFSVLKCHMLCICRTELVYKKIKIVDLKETKCWWLITQVRIQYHDWIGWLG